MINNVRSGSYSDLELSKEQQYITKELYMVNKDHSDIGSINKYYFTRKYRN